jgi:hypothetical protein
MNEIERSGRAQVTASPRPATVAKQRNPPTVHADRDSPPAGGHSGWERQTVAILVPFAQLTPVTRINSAFFPVLWHGRAMTPIGAPAPL